MSVQHCPHCGTPFVRAVAPTGMADRALRWFNVVPFRCQLCTYQFRAASRGIGTRQSGSDRRQFARLTTSMEARVLDPNEVFGATRVPDISMGGCSLSDVRLQKGAFVALALRPTSDTEEIYVKAAMVCSVRPDAVGVRFLELHSDAQQRLSQVVLGLLVGQSDQPTRFS